MYVLGNPIFLPPQLMKNLDIVHLRRWALILGEWCLYAVVLFLIRNFLIINVFSFCFMWQAKHLRRSWPSIDLPWKAMLPLQKTGPPIYRNRTPQQKKFPEKEACALWALWWWYLWNNTRNMGWFVCIPSHLRFCWVLLLLFLSAHMFNVYLTMLHILTKLPYNRSVLTKQFALRIILGTG